MKHDNVNHPAHYTDGTIEVIDYIEDKKLNYHRGNAVKYISRAGKKDKRREIEDIEKAIWYLKREVQRLKAARGETVTAPSDDPFPQCRWDGCEGAGQGCFFCPNNIYRIATAAEIFSIIFKAENLAGEGDNQAYVIDTLSAEVLMKRYSPKKEDETK